MSIYFLRLILWLLLGGEVVCVVLLWPFFLMEKGEKLSGFEGDIEQF